MNTKIEVNGKNIFISPTRSTFRKTANTIKNDILYEFEKIGITIQYVDLNLPRNPMKKDLMAEISWYVNGQDYYYSCDKQERYVDNLGVIGNVVKQEVYAIKNGLKSFGMVMNQFRLGYNEDVPKIKSPREIIGVPENTKDLDYISFKYKQLAKQLHPDAGGSAELFKELNEAYKQLKGELQ